MKPRVFIGSSTEREDEANAIQELLENNADVVLWTQDIFRLSESSLDSLLTALDEFDAGIFVFGPDDVVLIRNEKREIARDNVIFELGLFVGRLGKEHCFIVQPRPASKMHMPTDLLGVNPALYNPGKNLLAALGPACNKIRRELARTQDAAGQAAGRLGYFLRGVKETYLRHLAENRKRPKVEARLNLMLPSSNRDTDAVVLKIEFTDYESNFTEAELNELWQEGQGKCGVAWKQRKQTVYAAGVKDPETRFEAMGDKSSAAQVLKSVLSTPVLWKHEPIAVLNLDSQQGPSVTRVHTETVKILLKDAAHEVAPVLRQSLGARK